MLLSVRSLLAATLLAVAPGFGQTVPVHTPKAIPFGKVPLTFEANGGQADEKVRFLSHGSNYSIFVRPAEATLVVHYEQGTPAQRRKAMLKGSPLPAKQDVVQMSLAGAKPDATVAGERALSGYVNYMKGSSPSGFHTGIPTFAAARVQGAYPGIDLVYYGTERQLEYDFVVAPAADASEIKLHFAGARPVLSADGALRLQIGKSASASDISFLKPVIYQQRGGQREPVDGSFEVASNGDVSFHLGTYDHARELVIDPILSYGSYFGGTGEDEINGSAINSQNELYAVGQTFSTDLPATAGEFESTGASRAPNATGHDAFVTKFSADGSSVLWTTYLGGTGDDYAYGVTVSATDQAVVVGLTSSCGGGASSTQASFPFTQGAVQTLCAPSGGPNNTEIDNGGGTNAFVSRLSSDGKSLLYGTFLGGNTNYGDYASAVALDSSNNMYVVGRAYSTGYEQVLTPGGYKNNSDTPAWPENSLGVPGIGDSDFPTTATAYERGYTQAESVANCNATFCSAFGTESSFLSVISASGGNFLYSTVLTPPGTGGCGNGACDTFTNAVAVGNNGIVYVGGTTSSHSFPTTPGAFAPTCALGGGTECPMTGFVYAIDITKAGAASLAFGTYMNGTSAGLDPNGNNLPPGSETTGLAVDSKGNVVVVGDTNANNFPTTAGTFHPTCTTHGDGNGDSMRCDNALFVTKLSPTGSTLWSTLYGPGTSGDGSVLFAGGVALDSSDDVYVTLDGNSSSLPLKNAFSPSVYDDAYLLEFNSTATQLLMGTGLGTSGPGTSGLNKSLSLDSNLNAYFSGSAGCGGYGCRTIPTTKGSFSPASAGGNADGWVAKIITQQQPSATTLAVTPAGTITPGQNVTLTATVASASTLSGISTTPTGSVSFMNGTTLLGSGTIASGSASFTGPLPTGSDSITAVYAGDSGFNGSASSATVVNVSSSVATTTTLVVAPATASFGQAISLTSTTLSGTTPVTSGSVSFSAGNVVLATSMVGANGVASATATPAPGTYSVVASFTGTASSTNPTGSGSSASAGSPLTIDKATPAISLTATPANPGTGAAVTLTATVTGTGATPGGTITFKDGSNVLGNAIALANGVASYSTSTLATGAHAITASYSGDTNFNALTSGAQTVTVALGTVSVAFAATPTISPIGKNVVLAATVVSKTGAGTLSGTITFLDGSTSIGSGSITNGAFSVSTSMLAAGSHTLTASYGGNANFAPAASASVIVTVRAAAATTTTLSSSAASASVASSVTFTAAIASAATTGSPTGSVQFMDGTTALGTGSVNAGSASFTTSALTAGTHSITAIYSGDPLFLASTSSAFNQMILTPALSITASPTPLTIKSGQAGNLTLTLTPSGGFTGTVNFTCGTLPKDVSCVFNPATLTFTASSGPATDTLTIGTSQKQAVLATPKFFGDRGPAVGDTSLSLGVLLGIPGSGLALLGYCRRKRWPSPLKRLVMLAFLAFGWGALGVLSGCGSSTSYSDATPGTYTIPLTVTPTGGSAQTLNVSVVID